MFNVKDLCRMNGVFVYFLIKLSFYGIICIIKKGLKDIRGVCMEHSNFEYKKLLELKKMSIQELSAYYRKLRSYEYDINKPLETSRINDGIRLYDLLKRPEITINKLVDIEKVPKIYSKEVMEQVEIDIKYDGYIAKEMNEIRKMQTLENTKIPDNIDYDKVINIASEAKDKLKKIRPISLGQASRISGVNPSDITMLSIYLKKGKKNE